MFSFNLNASCKFKNTTSNIKIHHPKSINVDIHVIEIFKTEIIIKNQKKTNEDAKIIKNRY